MCFQSSFFGSLSELDRMDFRIQSIPFMFEEEKSAPVIGF